MSANRAKPLFRTRHFSTLRDTRHVSNRSENFGDQFRSGLRIEELADGFSKHPHTVEDDQSTGKEGRPRVSLRPSWSANQCRGDTDGGGQRGERVRTVMPCLSLKSPAFYGLRAQRHPTKKAFLQENSLPPGQLT